MTFDLTVFSVGVAGGALAELLKWYQLRESLNMPAYVKSPIYWIVTLLMILAGGVLALVHDVKATSLLLALNIGISAPLILKGLAATVPAQLQPKGEPGSIITPTPSLIDFIAGR